MSMKHHLYRTAAPLVIGFALVANMGGMPTAQGAKAPAWITTKGKTVHLTVIAAYNNVAGGFSFNGYAKGRLTITVPRGDTIDVTFSNASELSHSVVFTTYSKTLPTGDVVPAFKGAGSPNPANGVVKGTTQTFAFVASKAGKYLMICAVPGHLAAGMWDYFVVSATAKSGSVKAS